MSRPRRRDNSLTLFSPRDHFLARRRLSRHEHAYDAAPVSCRRRNSDFRRGPSNHHLRQLYPAIHHRRLFERRQWHINPDICRQRHRGYRYFGSYRDALDGDLRFLILGGPEWDILLITPALTFFEEESESWKRSPDFSYTLLANTQYLVGYVRSVAVNEIEDRIAETQNGITSDLFVGCLNGFANPSYSHHCISGIDFGVRLHAVPEPSTALLLCSGLVGLATRHRRLAAHPSS